MNKKFNFLIEYLLFKVFNFFFFFRYLPYNLSRSTFLFKIWRILFNFLNFYKSNSVIYKLYLRFLNLVKKLKVFVFFLHKLYFNLVYVVLNVLVKFIRFIFCKFFFLGCVFLLLYFINYNGFFIYNVFYSDWWLFSRYNYYNLLETPTIVNTFELGPYIDVFSILDTVCNKSNQGYDYLRNNGFVSLGFVEERLYSRAFSASEWYFNKYNNLNGYCCEFDLIKGGLLQSKFNYIRYYFYSIISLFFYLLPTENIYLVLKYLITYLFLLFYSYLKYFFCFFFGNDVFLFFDYFLLIILKGYLFFLSDYSVLYLGSIVRIVIISLSDYYFCNIYGFLVKIIKVFSLPSSVIRSEKRLFWIPSEYGVPAYSALGFYSQNLENMSQIGRFDKFMRYFFYKNIFILEGTPYNVHKSSYFSWHYTAPYSHFYRKLDRLCVNRNYFTLYSYTNNLAGITSNGFLGVGRIYGYYVFPFFMGDSKTYFSAYVGSNDEAMFKKKRSIFSFLLDVDGVKYTLFKNVVNTVERFPDLKGFSFRLFGPYRKSSYSLNYFGLIELDSLKNKIFNFKINNKPYKHLNYYFINYNKVSGFNLFYDFSLLTPITYFVPYYESFITGNYRINNYPVLGKYLHEAKNSDIRLGFGDFFFAIDNKIRFSWVPKTYLLDINASNLSNRYLKSNSLVKLVNNSKLYLTSKENPSSFIIEHKPATFAPKSMGFFTHLVRSNVFVDDFLSKIKPYVSQDFLLNLKMEGLKIENRLKDSLLVDENKTKRRSLKNMYNVYSLDFPVLYNSSKDAISYNINDKAFTLENIRLNFDTKKKRSFFDAYKLFNDNRVRKFSTFFSESSNTVSSLDNISSFFNIKYSSFNGKSIVNKNSYVYFSSIKNEVFYLLVFISLWFFFWCYNLFVIITWFFLNFNYIIFLYFILLCIIIYILFRGGFLLYNISILNEYKKVYLLQNKMGLLYEYNKFLGAWGFSSSFFILKKIFFFRILLKLPFLFVLNVCLAFIEFLLILLKSLRYFYIYSYFFLLKGYRYFLKNVLQYCLFITLFFIVNGINVLKNFNILRFVYLLFGFFFLKLSRVFIILIQIFGFFFLLGVCCKFFFVFSFFLQYDLYSYSILILNFSFFFFLLLCLSLLNKNFILNFMTFDGSWFNVISNINIKNQTYKYKFYLLNHINYSEDRFIFKRNLHEHVNFLSKYMFDFFLFFKKLGFSQYVPTTIYIFLGVVFQKSQDLAFLKKLNTDINFIKLQKQSFINKEEVLLQETIGGVFAFNLIRVKFWGQDLILLKKMFKFFRSYRLERFKQDFNLNIVNITHKLYWRYIKNMFPPQIFDFLTNSKYIKQYWYLYFFKSLYFKTLALYKNIYSTISSFDDLLEKENLERKKYRILKSKKIILPILDRYSFRLYSKYYKNDTFNSGVFLSKMLFNKNIMLDLNSINFIVSELPLIGNRYDDLSRYVLTRSLSLNDNSLGVKDFKRYDWFLYNVKNSESLYNIGPLNGLKYNFNRLSVDYLNDKSILFLRNAFGLNWVHFFFFDTFLGTEVKSISNLLKIKNSLGLGIIILNPYTFLDNKYKRYFFFNFYNITKKLNFKSYPILTVNEFETLLLYLGCTLKEWNNVDSKNWVSKSNYHIYEIPMYLFFLFNMHVYLLNSSLFSFSLKAPLLIAADSSFTNWLVLPLSSSVFLKSFFMNLSLILDRILLSISFPGVYLENIWFFFKPFFFSLSYLSTSSMCTLCWVEISQMYINTQLYFFRTCFGYCFYDLFFLFLV